MCGSSIGRGEVGGVSSSVCGCSVRGGGGGGGGGGVAAAAEDGRRAEKPEAGGAAPPVVMPDTPRRVRRCRRRHPLTVSWGERTIIMFMYSEREKVGGDLAWIKESARSSRRKGESVGPEKPKQEPPVTTAPPLPPKPSPGNPFLASDGDRNSGDPSSTQGASASAQKPDGVEDWSGSALFEKCSLRFPFLSRAGEHDGWSPESPTSGPAETSAEKSGPTLTGEGDGDAESEMLPPRTSKSPSSSSSRFFTNLPKVAGAVAVLGIAATVGVMVLRRRR